MIFFVKNVRQYWPLWMGFRYLRSKKDSKFLGLITVLSIMGIALGVSSLVVVLSVMDGFEEQMKKRMMSNAAHILIEPLVTTPGFDSGFVPKKTFTLNNSFASSLSAIQRIVFIVQAEAILQFERKALGVMIKGLSQEDLENKLEAFKDPDQEKTVDIEETTVYVGQQLAFELGLVPGDELYFLSPLETTGPLELLPVTQKAKIAGLFKSAVLSEEIHTVYATQKFVQRFIKKPEMLSLMEIYLYHFDQAPFVASLLKKEFPDLKVSDWQTIHAHLFMSLKLERACMFIVLAFIIIVASFNIVTTLTLMVLEKKKEISILLAMGATHQHIGRIFLFEGVFIGSFGIILGVLGSLLICIFLKKTAVIQLPLIYYDRSLPVSFKIDYYIGVISVAFMIVMAACWYPSRRAMRQSVLVGLR